MNMPISYGIATKNAVNQLICGDQHLIYQQENNFLIAVVDGLGHGADAYFAAKKIIETPALMKKNNINDMMKACHQNASDTVGGVLFLAQIQSFFHVTWTSVGNIYGVHWHQELTEKKDILLPQGGIIGFSLPKLRPSSLIAKKNDTLILATDGILTDFLEFQPALLFTPQQIADLILERYWEKHDDALVVVIRWE